MKKKKSWPWIVLLAVFTALMIVDIILWATSGSSSGNRGSFPGGSRPEVSTGTGSTETGSNDGSGEGSSESSGRGSRGNRPSMPEGFDGSFDPSNLPEGFDGSNMPGNFNPGSFDGNFDPDNLPEGFDTSNMPSGFSRGTKSSSWMDKLYLPVLLVCIAVDIFALIMLILAIRSNKKNGNGPEGGDGEHQGGENGEDDSASPVRKTMSRKVIGAVVLTLMAALSITLVILTKKKEEAAETGIQADENIMEASLEETSMAQVITAGGSITEQNTVEDYYPSGLEVTSYHVSEGDTVAAGDVIADVDRVSVMNTITEIQSVISSLDARLEVISEDRSDELESTAAGRIKKIFAEAGRTVVDIVKEDGALMLLSLDGKMAVDIETTDSFDIGEKVDVTLGSETLTGSVAAWKEGLITVTIDDSYGEIDEEVTVAKNDKTLGTGALYIHQALAVTGYAGVIDEVLVAEGDTLEKGDSLIRLSSEIYSAEYESLLQQRAKLQEQMKTCFELYQSGQIVAKTSGVVSSLYDALETVSFAGSGVDALQLSNSPTGADDSAYVNYAVLVTKVTEDELQIKMSANPIGDIDLTKVGSIGTAICTNAGTVTKDTISYVYGYNGTEWVQQSVGSIKAGEVIVATFDTDGNLIWVVRSAEQAATPEIPEGTTPGGKPEGTTPGSMPEGTTPGGKPEGTDPEGMETPTDPTGTETPTDPTGTETPTDPTGGETPTDPTGTDTPTDPTGADSTNPGGSGSEGGSGFPGGSGSSGYPGGSGSSGMPSGFSGSGSAASDGSSFQMPDITTGQDKSEDTVYAVAEISMISITPTETVTIEVSVDELDISNIHVGQSCEITFDAISAKSFEGTVTSIDTTGTNDGGNTKYSVTVTLPREENMLSGMNTHITFSYNEKSDALVIPEAALYEEAGKTYVYTGYDSKKDELTGKTEVTTGLADGEKVEILTGLTADDKVYYKYADSLTINIFPR